MTSLSCSSRTRTSVTTLVVAEAVLGHVPSSFTTLYFGLTHPRRALSLTLAGTGYGALAASGERAEFQAQARALADRLDSEGMEKVFVDIAASPTRASFARKDPAAFRAFERRLATHSSPGSAHTLRAIQAKRPAFDGLEDQLRAIETPMLLVAGDDDAPSISATIYLKQAAPSAGLYVLPRSGHMLNLEEATAFNSMVSRFLAAASMGTWGTHDIRCS